MKQLTPKEAQEILEKDGMHVSPEQAANILHFINLLAEITISQHLKK